MIGIPSNLRRVNQRLVFESLLRHGPGSRSLFAKATGLSVPTVGKVVDGLVEAGLVEEVEAESFGDGADVAVGRPARVVRLNRTTPGLVALQVGVRHTRVAALPVSGPLDDRWACEFATPSSPGAWLARVRKAAESLGVSRPWAVMVSVPGVVDEEAGRVLLCPNLHWLERADVPGLVGGVWDAPVRLVQEIRALALGHVAAEPGCTDFLLVDFGEGVGGAMVTGGRIYRSALPMSGELGHTPVAGNGRPCGCGAVGCLETLMSRPGLVETMGHAAPGARRNWRGLAARVKRVGVEPWLGKALDETAAVIAGAINVAGLREVVVTGSLVELGAAVMEGLAQRVQRASMWARFGQVVCRPAARRRAAGLVQAAIDRVLLPAQG